MSAVNIKKKKRQELNRYFLFGDAAVKEEKEKRRCQDVRICKSHFNVIRRWRSNHPKGSDSERKPIDASSFLETRKLQKEEIIQVCQVKKIIMIRNTMKFDRKRRIAKIKGKIVERK